MRLTRYRVTDFRSVQDSGWVEVDSVAALIGVNESGKTNLLLPLWKLNPAQEGDIHPTSDYPKKRFGEIRDAPGDFCFINAEFETGASAQAIADAAGITADEAELVIVKRFFDGSYAVSFPKHAHKTEADGSEVKGVFDSALNDIQPLTVLRQEETLKEALLAKLQELSAYAAAQNAMNAKTIGALATALQQMLPETPAKTSAIVPRCLQAIEQINQIHTRITAPAPQDKEGVENAVITAMPKFVYYSNYGNLDSEIYLPHVVQNLKRSDLGAKEAAKARTLRVLFKFVRLKPKEILELGQDFKDPSNPARDPTPEEIEAVAEKKRERSNLLQGAWTTLTTQFKAWWKQGDYRFRFEADGNHFRIWVSDDRRPEEVELESRSTGLQWFLSFYLVFLVESLGEHRNAILLLDEPGLSLHPLAQRDLSAFFDNLAKTNQIIYTTHSPFLVDADRLDRARKVFVSEDGTTKSTPDLRYGDADPRQAGAAYAVHSALNLNVAERLLLGCQPIVVEGPSDQHYLTAIKAILIGAKKIAPARELVFPPAGGAKTARIVASILTGRDERLPIMLLDGDDMGSRTTRELRSSLYSEAPGKILSTDDYAGYTNSEVEDLLPSKFFAEIVDRWARAETMFADVVVEGQPLIPQVEKWAKSNNLTLQLGWKVEIAKRAKEQVLKRGISAFDEAYVGRWVKLFEAFFPSEP